MCLLPKHEYLQLFEAISPNNRLSKNITIMSISLFCTKTSFSYWRRKIFNIQLRFQCSITRYLPSPTEYVSSRHLSVNIDHFPSPQVFDDVAVELAMAILQFFNSKPSEEYLFRCMKALAKFSQVSRQEVPQLIQMIGPDPKSFAGTSERVDQQIAEISGGRRI